MKVLKRVHILGIVFLVLLAFMPMRAEAATIKLNKTKCTVYLGETTTLKLSGTNKTVTWSSSDKKVATVNRKGKVTPKQEGKATITAKVGKKSYHCVVTVKKPYLNVEKKSLYVGKSYVLKITGTTAQKWTSSDKKIATVNSKGKVTAKKAGKVTIVCKGTDGKSYKCKIVIKNPYLNKTKKSLHQGDTYTLKITGTTPEKWISSDKKIATVDSEGKVTAQKAGKVTITCKGRNGKSYKCVIKVEGHSYSKQVIKKATCTKTGVTKYTCACGYSVEKKKSRLNHNWKQIEVKATCTKEGKLYQKCTSCNKTETLKTLEKTEHSYKETILKEPTCTKTGLAKYTCDCGTSEYTQTLEKAPHDYAETVLVKPSCTTYGEVFCECKNCDETTFYYIINEHDYKRVEVKASCQWYGGVYKECKDCGERQLVEKKEEKLPHKYTSRKVKPTCQSGGGTLYECKNCEDSYYGDNYVDVIDHDYQYRVINEPDCEWNGYAANVCTMCEEEEWRSGVYIDALGHAYKGETDATGRMIACERCEVELFHLLWESEDGYLENGMISVAGDEVSMMPGTSMCYEIEEVADTYWYEYLSVDLTEGTPRYNDFGEFDGRTDENVSLGVALTQVSAKDRGSNQIVFKYEDKIVDCIDIKVEGDTLVEAYHKYASGNQTAIECFPADFQQMIRNADAVIRECITEEMTDCQKVEAIQNWMYDNVRYVSSSRYDGQRAVITLVDGEAVCAGYAECFMFFMDLLDIPCYSIFGLGYNATVPGPHAWNMVQMDTGNGKGLQWYYVDTTWGYVYCEFDITVAEWNEINGEDGVWRGHEAINVIEYHDWSYLLSSWGISIWSMHEDLPFPQ